jgi:hypothetical protein
MRRAILMICVVSEIVPIMTDALLGLQHLRLSLRFLSVERTKLAIPSSELTLGDRGPVL